MKKLSKILICLVLVMSLTLSMTSCVKPTPPVTPSPTPVVTTTPKPEVPTPTPVEPTKKPGGGISFPDGWDKPTENEFSIEDLDTLEGSGSYTVKQTNSSESISIENLEFEGKIFFIGLTALNNDIEINMPKATLELGTVECAKLRVTSGLNTAKFNGETKADVTLLGGNAVVGTSAKVNKITIDANNKTSRTIDIQGGVSALVLDAQMDVKMSGTAIIENVTATKPVNIILTGQASLKAFANKVADTSTIKSSITVADGASVEITENTSGLVIDATGASGSTNVKLSGNGGNVEVVKDLNDTSKGEITLGDGVKEPVETNKGILTLANSPVEIIKKTGSEIGYLRFNFSQIEGYTVSALVMNRDGTKYLELENSEINGATTAKSFDWALRDYVTSDEVKNGDTVQDTEALRNASNKFLSRKDDEVVFSITATENPPAGGFANGVTAKNQTLTYNYKISEDVEKNSAITISGAGVNNEILAFPTALFASVRPTIEENCVNVGFKFNKDGIVQKFRYYDVSSIVVELYVGNKVVSTSTANILTFGDCFAGSQLNLFTAQFYANNKNSGHWLRKGDLKVAEVPTKATMKMVMRDGRIVTAEQAKFTNVNGDEFLTEFTKEDGTVIKFRKEDGIINDELGDKFDNGDKSQSYENMFCRVIVDTDEQFNKAVENDLVKEIIVNTKVTLTKDLTIGAGKTLIVPSSAELIIPSGKTLAILSGATMTVNENATMTIDGELTRENGATVEFLVNDAVKLEKYLEAGQCLTLTSDITLPNGNTIDIVDGKTSVLNMATFKITYGGEGARPIQNQGNLTIFGGGTFEVTSVDIYGVIDNMKGTVYAENCTFTAPQAAQEAAILRNRPAATMTLKNVNVYSDSELDKGSECIYNDGKLIIDGGNFRCMSGLTSGNGTYAIRSMGGEFEISKAEVYGAKGALALCGGVQKVHSGTYTAKNWYALYIAGEKSMTVATIVGGVFESAGVACVLVGNDNTNGDGGINAPAYAEITGGSFSNTTDGKPVIMSAKETGKAVVVGGTFDEDIDDGDYAEKGFVKATYECVPNHNNTGFIIQKKETLTARTANELVALVGAVENGDEIALVDNITLTSPLLVDKSLTICGGGIENTKLSGRIISSKSLTLRDLKVENETAISEGVITLNSDDAKLLLERVKVIQNKSGTADNWAGMAFGIVTEKADGESPNNASIILKNSEILLNKKYQRGIATAGNATGGTITLDNSIITSVDNPSNASYCRGISTFEMTDMVVNITNKSRIEGVYYAINTATDTNLIVNVDDSFVAGYAAINCWSDGVTFNIKNGSVLEGRNYYKVGTNDFSTIVINDNKTKNKINIENSTIKNIPDGDAEENLIDTRRSYETTIKITGMSKLINNKDNVAIRTIYGTDTVVNIEDSVTFGGAFGANDADFMSEIIELGIGETVVLNESISTSPTVKLCKFSPSESGTYSFVGNSESDNILVVLDKNGAYHMAYDDQSNGDSWFKAQLKLNAGQTYYFYIGAYGNGQVVVNVTIEKVG